MLPQGMPRCRDEGGWPLTASTSRRSWLATAPASADDLLDPAAVVKLARAEPGSAALRGRLDERAETGWISSVLTEIESFRALGQEGPVRRHQHVTKF